jgi:hypothetical protein
MHTKSQVTDTEKEMYISLMGWIYDVEFDGWYSKGDEKGIYSDPYLIKHKLWTLDEAYNWQNNLIT